MKCDRCNGQGFSVIAKWKCPVCDGKGVVEPLTEQEYIQTCNTEQLVKVFGSMLFEAWKDGLAEEMHDKRFYENLVDFWLKQPHQ